MQTQVRRRKESVQRLGVSIGVRYSATYGVQYWLAPYFFLLPGVRILWTLYQSMVTMLLSSLALVQRCVWYKYVYSVDDARCHSWRLIFSSL